MVAQKIFSAPCEPEVGLEGQSLEQRRCAEDIVLSTEGGKNPPSSFGKLYVSQQKSALYHNVSPKSQKNKSHSFSRDPCMETSAEN